MKNMISCKAKKFILWLLSPILLSFVVSRWNVEQLNLNCEMWLYPAKLLKIIVFIISLCIFISLKDASHIELSWRKHKLHVQLQSHQHEYTWTRGEILVSDHARRNQRVAGFTKTPLQRNPSHGFCAEQIKKCVDASCPCSIANADLFCTVYQCLLRLYLKYMCLIVSEGLSLSCSCLVYSRV